MGLDLNRLRTGERIVAVSAVLLFIVMFFLKWYGVNGHISVQGVSVDIPGFNASVNAWHGLSILRWLLLATIIVALYTVWVTATQRAPALPVAGSVLTAGLGILISVLVFYRVIISHPGSNSVVTAKLGAYLGLLCCIGIAVGGWRAMQDEGTSFREAGEGLDARLGNTAGGQPRPAPPAAPGPPSAAPGASPPPAPAPPPGEPRLPPPPVQG